MNYKPSRDLPDFAREAKTLSWVKLSEMVLNRRNEKVTADSVRMWFKRNPQVYAQLRNEIIEGLPTEKEQVDSSIFQRRLFEELPTIKTWILEMKARDLSKGYMLNHLDNLRLICRGVFPKHCVDLVSEGKWSLKHPDRLGLQDAMEIIALLKDKGIDTCHYKRVLKDFLTSKGVVVGKKIAVGKSKSYGKLAKLFVPMPALSNMLEWVRTVDFEAYVADCFMFKTGTRLTATLKALIENLRSESRTVLIYDKARRSIHPEGKEWEKYIPQMLWTDLQTIIGTRRYGRIFQGLTDTTLEKLNREALRLYAPALEPKIRMPNHFWRHMFFQHLLRITDWNYAVCAELGGSTIASLQESYGRPPDAIIREWGLKYMPTLEASEAIPIQIVRMTGHSKIKGGRPA